MKKPDGKNRVDLFGNQKKTMSLEASNSGGAKRGAVR